MKKTRTILLITLWGSLALALIIILVAEFKLVLPGALTGNRMAEDGSALILELLMLAVIPLAYSLFKWKKVREDLGRRKEKALLFWGMIRLLLLCLPMVASSLADLFFVKNTFFYITLILGISLFLVYPSAERCAKELESGKTKE